LRTAALEAKQVIAHSLKLIGKKNGCKASGKPEGDRIYRIGVISYFSTSRMKVLKAIRLRGSKSVAFDTFSYSGNAGGSHSKKGI